MGAGSLNVRVLFFGATADVTGMRSTTLNLPEASASADAVERILKIYPSLSSHKLLYAVNQAYATGRERLKNDDELAIFTAVSGG